MKPGSALNILQGKRALWRRHVLRRMSVWRAGFVLCFTSAENIADKLAPESLFSREYIIKCVIGADKEYDQGARAWEEE